MEQKTIDAANDYKGLDEWLEENKINNLFLVCDDSLKFLESIKKKLDKLANTGINITRFNDFCPNPLYQSVVSGVDAFRKSKGDGILAIGGGSAIDVAKCIKLYSNMSGDGACGDYLKQTINPNKIPFLAVPTTAGTGSEATRYAVIYYEGKKQSISDYSCIPDTVLMDSSVLKTLPLYQKKSTMCDALCHAIESFWSVNSTDESKKLSKDAIELVLKHMDGYLDNTDEGNQGMLLAANTAGKAINITQTTAGHAMCYKITSLFNVAHGHAAALCVRKLFPWMLSNMDKCIDKRGKTYLSETFNNIAQAMGCKTSKEACEKLNSIFNRLELSIPIADESQLSVLESSVNPDRLKNNPIGLDSDSIRELYREILSPK